MTPRLDIALVVGNRPQFVKLMPVYEALLAHGRPTLIHTGQHHDYAMSDAHFADLRIPAPDVNLGISGGGHAEQTARLLVALDGALAAADPGFVILFGDTNSTVAAALAAVKRHIRIAHVESGPRMNDRFESPEEANRVLTERIADLLFPPSQGCADNLARDGRAADTFFYGDTMFDTFLRAKELGAGRAGILERLNPSGRPYALVTLHRPRNVDDPAVLSRVIDGLLACPYRVVFPCHPRTRQSLERFGLLDRLAGAPNVTLLESLGYLDNNALLTGAELVVTDSGGLQKEAYFGGKRCLTLYPHTPWPEIRDLGFIRLVDPVTQPLAAADYDWTPGDDRPLFGAGDAGRKIAAKVVERLTAMN